MAAARPMLQNMTRESRRAERHEVSFRSELRDGDEPGVPIHMVDVSTLGFRARCDVCVVAGSIRVALPAIGFISARVVWALGGRIGGEFHRPIDPDLYQRMLDAAPQHQSWHD